MENKPLDSDKFCSVSEEALEFLKSKMKGQDSTIDSLVKAVDLGNSSLQRRGRPLHSALLIGPAKCGKRYLVQKLSELYFGNQNAFVRIPCYQFDKKLGSLSQLEINSPAYSVRIEHNKKFKDLAKKYHKFQKDNDDLVNELNANPKKKKVIEKKLKKVTSQLNSVASKYIPEFMKLKSIIFFEHIADCDAEQMTLMTEILEGRRLTVDGRILNFENSIIFLSCSNVLEGFDESSSSEDGLGFKSRDSKLKKKNPKDKEDHYIETYEQVDEYFLSRFLSAIDRVYIYQPYQLKSLIEILKLELDQFHKELVDEFKFPIVIKPDPEVLKFIAEESSDKLNLGMKLLKSKFDKYIRRPIGRMKNSGEISKKDILKLKLRDSKILFFKESRPSK